MLAFSLALAADNAAYRAALEAESGWALVESKVLPGLEEPVVVRHKEVSGQHCLEGSTHASLSPDLLLTLAADIPNQPSWSTWDVAASVKLTSGVSFDYYQVLENPSPVADRFWFVHASTARQGEDRIFRWEMIDPNLYPAALSEIQAKWPGSVSPTVNVGDWTFRPENGKTLIRYRICTDSGGSLPAWVGQYAAKTTLPTNLSDLIKKAQSM
jgi:hypothetical protein